MGWAPGADLEVAVVVSLGWPSVASRCVSPLTKPVRAQVIWGEGANSVPSGFVAVQA